MISPRQASLLIAALFVCGSRTSAQSDRSTVVGHLGLSAIECDCTFDGRNPTNRIFQFRSDLIVMGVASGGPADGILMPGDEITDIDGIRLRTREGGIRFANIRPGQRVTLGVRRNRRALRVYLTAAPIRLDDPSGLGEYIPLAPGADDREYPPPSTPRAPGVPGVAPAPRAPSAMGTPRPAEAPTPGVPPRASTPGAVPVPPVVPVTPSPRGWFGFSIRCNECGWSRNNDEPTPRWESTSPPEISLIAPGSPADRAGFRTGDRITHIDGLSILERAGSRRFGAVRPGQRVRLTVLRGSRSVSNDLVLTERPGAASRRRTLRYTGSLKDVDVEVWSPQGATVHRDGETLTINIGGSTVVLKAK